MPCKDVLDKIVSGNPDIRAAMVFDGERVVHNCEAPYDMLDVAAVLETVAEIYEMTQALEDEDVDIGDLVLGFDDHAITVRRFDGDKYLAALTGTLKRAQVLKVQVSLGLYLKAIAKALEEEPAPAHDAISAPVAKAEAEVMPDPVPAEEPKKKVRYYRGVAYYD